MNLGRSAGQYPPEAQDLSINSFAVWTIVPLLFLALLRLIFVTPIYYDGSFFIFFNAIYGTYANIDTIGRLAGHFLYETPALLYAKFAAPSLKVSTYIYSATVIFLPFLLLIGSYFTLEKDKKGLFAFPVLSYSLLLITSLYFEVSEIHLANGLLWLLGTILLKKDCFQKIGWHCAFILLLALMSFTYPLLILTAPVIIYYIVKKNQSRLMRVLGILYTLIFLMITLFLTFKHDLLDPKTTQNFYQSILRVLNNASGLSGIIILLGLFVSNFFNKKEKIVFTLICLSTLIFSLVRNQSFMHFNLYEGRTIGVIALTGLFYYSLLFASSKRQDPAVWIYKTYVVLITSLALSGLYLYNWNQLKNEVVQNSNIHSGILEWDEFSLHSYNFRNASTHWNAEMFSVLIQHLEGVPVKVVVRKHPNSLPSVYDHLGKDHFLETLKNLNVSIQLAGP